MKSFLKIEKILLIILLISSLHFSNFFLNSFIILTSKYDERMERIYGSCGNESYSFIKMVNDTEKLDKNILIFHISPYFAFNNSNWFTYKVNKKYYEDRLILINEDNNLKKNKSGNYSLYDRNKILIQGEYKIIIKQKNCYYMKKND